jgi:hypothetical protein
MVSSSPQYFRSSQKACLAAPVSPKRFSDRKAAQDDEMLAKMEEFPEMKYDSEGRIVLYRGPPAMKTWIYYLVGGSFLVIGWVYALLEVQSTMSVLTILF